MIKYFNVILICITFFIVSCEKNPVNNQNHQDDDLILFIRNIGNEYSQICTIRPNGSELDFISQTEFGYNNIGYQEARWSPDKSKIVVVGGLQSSPDIWPLWLINMNGEFIQKLTNNGMDPVWINDNQVLYHKPRGYSIATCQDIFLIDIQTYKETKVYNQTDSLSIRIFDYFTTDNSYIAYLSDESLNVEHLISRFQINNVSKYTIIYHYDTYRGVKPKFSPDEEKIIFAQGIYQNNDIYLLDIITNNIVNITNNPGEYHSLAWSSDGQRIAFSKENSSLSGEFKYTCDIFIFDLTADTCINLTGSYSDSISCHVMDWK